VRDIDINANKPYYFASGGDDCKVKFWDQRKLEKPLKVLSKHAHWVWKVQYNPRFDALMISSSTDGTVNLWNVGSLSFQNPNVLDESSLADLNADKLVKTYDDHEDSIYSICWSLCDDRPWDWASFASLSYDGRVVVNRVPEKEARKGVVRFEIFLCKIILMALGAMLQNTLLKEEAMDFLKSWWKSRVS